MIDFCSSQTTETNCKKTTFKPNQFAYKFQNSNCRSGTGGTKTVLDPKTYAKTTETCLNKCSQMGEGSCRNVVYKPPTGGGGGCPSGATCFRSSDGTKYASYKLKDINGGDFSSHAGSQSDCANWCSSNSKCKSFDWNSSQKHCYFCVTDWTSNPNQSYHSSGYATWRLPSQYQGDYGECTAYSNSCSYSYESKSSLFMFSNKCDTSPKIWKRRIGCTNHFKHFAGKSVLNCNAECKKYDTCKKFVMNRNNCWLLGDSCTEIV